MKKVLLIVLLLTAASAFGQEDIFKHIDFFIQNFPQTNQEARDKLASWGYINDGNPIDSFVEYVSKYYTYEIGVRPRINESSNNIDFRFIFYGVESREFYQVYRAAITFFTEKYFDFSETIVNNDHVLTSKDSETRISISIHPTPMYPNTVQMHIFIQKRRLV
jgi:hypothetical protein